MSLQSESASTLEMLEERFELIKDIMMRYLDVSNTYPHLKKKRNVLIAQSFHTLDKMIGSMENNYYRYILRNQNVSSMTTELDKNIFVSQQILESVLPLLIFGTMSARDSMDVNANLQVSEPTDSTSLEETPSMFAFDSNISTFTHTLSSNP
jgi:hypothetical protein